MKERFSTIDLFSVVEHLNGRVLGMRVANIYDIDHKTYLIKLSRSEEKIMLLFESGCRMHTTAFDWPKHMQPSGFSMKLRKHLRAKRLVAVTQLGVDRVVDLQFGSAEYAHHLIIELYDRGNVILTDHSYTILSLLRVRTDNDTDVKFAIRESFSMETIKQEQPLPDIDQVKSIFAAAKPGDQLKHILNPHFVFGPAIITHCLIGVGFPENAKIGSQFDQDKESDIDLVMAALSEAHTLFQRLRVQPCKGYIIQKKEITPLAQNGDKGAEGGAKSIEDLVMNIEFHPMLFRQYESSCYQEYETFNKAVDEFFSSKTSQKQDVKTHHLQKAAFKKLDNIKQDHFKRLEALKQSQDEDKYKAELIELNSDLVEKACIVIRSAVASAMDWGDIHLLVRDAQMRGDPVASIIHSLKLHSNLITLQLREPYESDNDNEIEEKVQKKKKKPKKGIKVDVDLSLSVYANARRYYDQKKQAARKEQKTIDASEKALKSAEKKTKQSLKQAAVVSHIQKARKVHWFEKFYWFISSENYLALGGRDQQQNELVVKKYLNDTDIYVHADLHGATSVIVKNPTGGPVPPKTLNEAGIMAVCYSSAWEAKIVTSAWWVYANQVSKTAPSGEYLTTGSFMIRGKKNFLPPCQLALGFAILFKLDETSISNHLNERRVRETDDDQLSMISDAVSEVIVDDEEDIPEDLEEEEEEEDEREPGIDQPLEEEEEEEEEEEDEFEFPDTAIQIQMKEGIKFEFQRSISAASSIPDTGVSDTSIPLDDTTGLYSDDDQEDKLKSSYKHLSAKEKRILKKQGKKNQTIKEESEDKQTAKEKERFIGKKQSPDPVSSQQQYKRGQKSKQKKIKERYWDQDDEERQMRMEILASAGVPKEIKGKKGKAKRKKGDLGQTFNPKAKYHQKNKEKTQVDIIGKQHKQKGPVFVKMESGVISEEEESELLVLDVENEPQDETLKQYKSQDGISEMEELQDGSLKQFDVKVQDSNEILHSTQNIVTSDNSCSVNSLHTHTLTSTTQIYNPTTNLLHEEPNTNGLIPELHVHETQTELTNNIDEEIDESDDEEEKKALIEEENLLQLEELKKDSLIVDSLTGSPLPEDILLFALPVCAPYSALHNYKFKVKLIPGPNRRGKAAKTALHKYIQNKETTQIEKDLLRSIKDNDLSRYFPGKVKMTIPQQILRTKHK